MTKFNYSPYKILDYPEIISGLQNGENVPPLMIQIFLVNYCNSNCHFCYYAIRNSTTFQYKDGINWNRLNVLLDELKSVGTKSLVCSGGGEPCLYKHFDKFVNKAQNLFDMGLITNGVFPEKILPHDWKWVRISLNASNSNIYQYIDQGTETEFNKVIDSIPQLVAKTDVGLGFVITNRNYQDIFDFAKFAKSLGVSNVRFGIEHTGNGIDVFDKITELDEIESRKFIDRELSEAESLIDSSFYVYTPRHKINNNRKPFDTCHYLKVHTLICADGSVASCCLKAYKEKTNIGNIYDSSFSDIWSSKKRQNIINSINVHVDCNNCHYDDKNSMLDYIINGANDNNGSFV